jgi:hypothetical protein
MNEPFTNMAITLSHTIPQPHSILSLPRELRNMVYANVFSFSHSTCASSTRRHELHCGTKSPAIVRLTAISFDWIDLMRTNGIIADEMRQLYHMPSRYTSAANRTWSMQLLLNNDEYTLAWTSLPCPSSFVRHLSIDLKINLTLSMFGHWDNDSKDAPGKIFAAMLELLTQITHHGPNIAVFKTLHHHIVFETLSLNISFADEEKTYARPSGPETIYILGYGKSRIYNRLIEDMVAASGNHVLKDKVENIRIQGPKSLGLPKTDIKTV